MNHFRFFTGILILGFSLISFQSFAQSAMHEFTVLYPTFISGDVYYQSVQMEGKVPKMGELKKLKADGLKDLEFPKLTVVITGPNGYIEMQGYERNNYIRLMPNSIFQIVELKQENRLVRLDVGSGFFWLKEYAGAQESTGMMVNCPNIMGGIRSVGNSCIYMNIAEQKMVVLQGKSACYNTPNYSRWREIMIEAGKEVIMATDLNPMDAKPTESNPQKVLDMINAATAWDPISLDKK